MPDEPDTPDATPTSPAANAPIQHRPPESEETLEAGHIWVNDIPSLPGKMVGSDSPGIGPPPFNASYVEKQHTKVRGWLAVGFMALFAFTAIFALCIVAFGDASTANRVETLMNVLIPTETALLGSAVGFYFAANN